MEPVANIYSINQHREADVKKITTTIKAIFRGRGDFQAAEGKKFYVERKLITVFPSHIFCQIQNLHSNKKLFMLDFLFISTNRGLPCEGGGGFF